MGQFNYVKSVTATTPTTAPLTDTFEPNQKHITAIDVLFEFTDGWIVGVRLKDHGQQFFPHQASPSQWLTGIGGVNLHYDCDYDLEGDEGGLALTIETYNTDASARLVQVRITTQDHPIQLILRQLLAVVGKWQKIWSEQNAPEGGAGDKPAIAGGGIGHGGKA